MLKIGSECEARSREASKKAKDARSSTLPYADEIRAKQDENNEKPVSERATYLRSDAYGDNSGDIESWLHGDSPQFDDAAGEYTGEAPRLEFVSSNPPKKTRQTIVRNMAIEHDLTESQVDNLWQAFRRFEKDTRP